VEHCVRAYWKDFRPILLNKKIDVCIDRRQEGSNPHPIDIKYMETHIVVEFMDWGWKEWVIY
jgi:hypothetical protein